MQVTVEYEGKTYKGVENKDVKASDAANALYEGFESYDKLQLELEDGSVLILGKHALQSCVIVIK